MLFEWSRITAIQQDPKHKINVAGRWLLTTSIILIQNSWIPRHLINLCYTACFWLLMVVVTIVLFELLQWQSTENWKASNDMTFYYLFAGWWDYIRWQGRYLLFPRKVTIKTLLDQSNKFFRLTIEKIFTRWCQYYAQQGKYCNRD